MPLYDYRCENCEVVFERLLKLCEMEIPLSQPCPQCGSEQSISQELTTANFGDPVRMGVKRPDAGFGEVLSRVKSAHPNGMKSQKFSPIAGR
jgi:putative FmdB family regulatory protein